MHAYNHCCCQPIGNRFSGIVNLTVDTRFAEIFLDAFVTKYKGLACQ